MLLAARERADLTHRQLFTQLIFFKLVLDVFRNSARILSYRIHVVSPALEFSISVLILQLAELLIQHRAALTFQITHKARHCHFRQYLNQHMDMVRAHFCFDDVYTFLFTQLPQDLSNSRSVVFVEYFSTIFRRKYNMITSY